MPLSARQRIAAVAFVAGAFVLAAVLGPRSRAFLPVPEVATVGSVDEFYALCRERGLKGRRAVVLARAWIPAEDPRGDSPGTQRLIDLMHHGVVRELFLVVEDGAWPQIHRNLSMVSIYRESATGLVAAFEDGRVNVDPLSRFWPRSEPVLLLVDPASWDPAGEQAIARLVESGRLQADLVAIVGGGPQDVRRWMGAVGGNGP